jgi:hypothetical protein
MLTGMAASLVRSRNPSLRGPGPWSFDQFRQSVHRNRFYGNEFTYLADREPELATITLQPNRMYQQR